MIESLNSLSAARQAHVHAALIALDAVERPLPQGSLPALADASLRHIVEECLAAMGRVLISSEDGYISGYDDSIAERLAQEGIGILPAADRAVLTFVILLSVAVPRASGELPTDASWTVGRPVPDERFKGSALDGINVDSALRRLGDAGLVRRVPGRGVVPGRQFHRLTKNATARLFEELIILSEPHGSLAESINRRRASRQPYGRFGEGVSDEFRPA